MKEEDVEIGKTTVIFRYARLNFLGGGIIEQIHGPAEKRLANVLMYRHGDFHLMAYNALLADLRIKTEP